MRAALDGVELEHGKFGAPAALSYRPWKAHTVGVRSSNRVAFLAFFRVAPPAPRLHLISGGILPCHYEFEIVLRLQYSSPKSNIYTAIRQKVHTTTQAGVTRHLRHQLLHALWEAQDTNVT